MELQITEGQTVDVPELGVSLTFVKHRKVKDGRAAPVNAAKLLVELLAKPDKKPAKKKTK